MLNVARLKILNEVAHRGSFSAAADALEFVKSKRPSALASELAASARGAGVGAVTADRARR